MARVELFGDSVRRWSPSKTVTTKAESGVDYSLSFSGIVTPFDEVRIAKRLLRQPKHTLKLPGDSTVSLSVEMRADGSDNARKRACPARLDVHQHRLFA